MTNTGAPLRFIVLLLAGWIGGRCLALFGDRLVPDGRAFAQSVSVPVAPTPAPAPMPREARPESMLVVALYPEPPRTARPRPAASVTLDLPPEAPERPLQLAAAHPMRAPLPIVPRFLTQSRTVAARLSGTAWLFLRPGMGGSLANAGQLGGSQSGARLRWRLNRGPDTRTALTARLSTDLRGIQGAELATGIEGHPLANLPVWLAAERRIALGPGGRNAWSAYAAGGFWKPGLPGGTTLDGYAQAGVVGVKHRDLFVDGALRLSRPLGGERSVKLGAGLWGAAQPGISRLDAGPFVAVPLKLGRHHIPLAIEGRLRVAGNAMPGSGVAVTMASDF